MILKIKKILNVGGVVKAPPSKSYTHRAIIIASLAEGLSTLYDPLLSEDTLSSIEANNCFGAVIEIFDCSSNNSNINYNTKNSHSTNSNNNSNNNNNNNNNFNNFNYTNFKDINNNSNSSNNINNINNSNNSNNNYNNYNFDDNYLNNGLNNSYLKIRGTENIENHSKEPIDLKNSGTTLRIMTSVAGLANNETILTGDDSLKTRPMGLLLDAIKPLGVEAESLQGNGKPPILIKPKFIGGETSIDGNVSSQFISSILIAGVLSEKGVKLEVKGDFISKSYVAMTLDVMEKFGVQIETDLFKKHEGCDLKNKKCASTNFKIEPQKYIATDYVIEGDYSSSSYLLGAIAILGGKIKVKNLFKDSKQGDKLILDILEKMGSEIRTTDDTVTLISDGTLKGINIDLHNAPDLLPTVSVLASLATGKTKITGVKHARFKETDRIAKCSQELRKLKCKVKENEDGMEITGGVEGGKVDSHNDHRLAMAFSLIGLKKEISIENGNSFSVSFPNFIEAMAEIGIELELIN
jgi:3-phosphoshikimate 1-carboxyvinyltransferase